MSESRPGPRMCVVVPCFNEEDALPVAIAKLLSLLDQLDRDAMIDASSNILFVDDGSGDRTWAMVEQASKEHSRIKGIKLTRNFGHQYALLAGLLHAEGDVVISIDADLQDDLSVIPLMISSFVKDDHQIVYGVRKNRSNDGFFKRWSAESYYRLLSAMGVNIVFNHADFRLLGRKAIDALREYGEANIFLRGIVPMLGFSASSVYYDRKERSFGSTKYPVYKMLSLALVGITSLSAFPLRLITYLGFIVSSLSFMFGIWTIWARLHYSTAAPGWASTLVPIYFLGGIQLLSIGVIGEYVSKIYLESKARPRFLIEKMI